MNCNHIRTSSASTGGGRERAMSTFSEGYTTATTAPSSPATSMRDISSSEDEDELHEIDKDTFEANVQHSRKDSCQNEKPARTDIVNDAPKIIDGSTFGGNDPLHAYIRDYDMEPRWWIEERQREDRKAARPPTTKRKRTSQHVDPTYLDPEWYDTLPYSRQDGFTSGLDMDAELERTSEQFWKKVQGAWELSMRFETVDERRDAFAEDFFGSVPNTPERKEFKQTWFEDELTVGETW